VKLDAIDHEISKHKIASIMN